jgi:hypothetical protein
MQASFSTEDSMYIETLFIRDTITKSRHDYPKREYARWDYFLLLFYIKIAYKIVNYTTSLRNASILFFN